MSFTGIGRGAAVPHAKLFGIVNMTGAIAEFPEGVEFDSLDGEPVRTVYLIISPIDRPGDHLRHIGNDFARTTEKRLGMLLTWLRR